MTVRYRRPNPLNRIVFQSRFDTPVSATLSENALSIVVWLEPQLDAIHLIRVHRAIHRFDARTHTRTTRSIFYKYNGTRGAVINYECTGVDAVHTRVETSSGKMSKGPPNQVHWTTFKLHSTGWHCYHRFKWQPRRPIARDVRYMCSIRLRVRAHIVQAPFGWASG